MGSDVNPSPPSRAEVKNEWNYISSAPTDLHGVERSNVTFTLFVYLPVFIFISFDRQLV
jgi:hypothetical protein